MSVFASVYGMKDSIRTFSKFEVKVEWRKINTITFDLIKLKSPNCIIIMCILKYEAKLADLLFLLHTFGSRHFMFEKVKYEYSPK